MACVSWNPQYIDILNTLLEKAKNVDQIVKHWPIDLVNRNVYELADNVVSIPSRKVLKRKTTKENKTTFHDGHPVKVVELSRGESLLLKVPMHEESARVLSFHEHGWPSHSSLSPSLLAKAGFFYFGVTDTVQCFSCQGRINIWAPGDTAMGEHKKFYPKCKFVRGMDNRNIPIQGLSYEKKKSTDVKQSSKSRPSDSPVDEAGCSDDMLSNLLSPLNLEESQPPVETTNHFKKEFTRLLSFKNWPISSPVDPYDLAAAGFYTLNETTVQCFACFGRLSQWKLGDRPIDEHRRLFPACPFIKGHPTGNVPITQSEKDQAVKYFAEGPRMSQAHQIASNLPESQRLNASASGRSIHPLTLATSEEPADLTVTLSKYPRYAYEQARLETYGQWPRNHYQIPANLARAGFFATGDDDEVKCFYCGGGLKDWDMGDEPWEEHARWFIRCDWLLQQRGPGFVDTVRRKYAPVETSYFEPNTGIPSDETSAPSPASPPGKASQVTGPARSTPSARTSEPAPKPIESRKNKKQPTKKQTDKKKQGKKSKSLNEKVEEQFQSDVVKFMIDMGQDEAIIRAVLYKRLQPGQSAYENSEDLLTAIFKEEELQKRGASSGSSDSKSKAGKKKSESNRNTRLVSGTNRKSPVNVEKKHELKERNQTLHSSSSNQLFGQFKLKLADQLPKLACLQLATYFELPRSKYDSIKQSGNMLSLLQMLEERGIIDVYNVTPLEAALRQLDLNRAAREVSEYQNLISRMPHGEESRREESPSGRNLKADDFIADPEFVELLTRFSEYITRSDVIQLCTYFTLSPHDIDEIMENKKPAKSFLMLLYKMRAISQADVTFLIESLKELDLWQAVSKLQELMTEDESELSTEHFEEEPGDMQSEELEKLREKNLCKICLDQDVEILFLPCKHLVTCADCASRIDMCPICRGTIEDKLYVFMP